MSGGVTFMPLPKRKDKDGNEVEIDQEDPKVKIYQRIISGMRTTPKEAAPEAPTAAPTPKSKLEDIMPKQEKHQGRPAAPSSLQSGATPDPNTFEVVISKSEGTLFKDPSTGKVWTGMELRKLPGHENKLNEGKIKQLEMMGK